MLTVLLGESALRASIKRVVFCFFFGSLTQHHSCPTFNMLTVRRWLVVILETGEIAEVKPTGLKQNSHTTHIRESLRVYPGFVALQMGSDWPPPPPFIFQQKGALAFSFSASPYDCSCTCLCRAHRRSFNYPKQARFDACANIKQNASCVAAMIFFLGISWCLGRLEQQIWKRSLGSWNRCTESQAK